MNKIMNGKRYDTETAKEIISKPYHRNGNYTSEDYLYLKKTGEFFIYHWTNHNDIWDREEYIHPISNDEAKSFVAENSDADTYEEIFGKVEE